MLGAFIGIGITAAVLGFMSVSLILVLIYIGMIRIMPLFELLSKMISTIIPSHVASLKENIKESFKVRFTEDIPEGNYIYAWHPHGVIAMSQYFHMGTSLTNWPQHIKNIKVVVLAALLWLPFSQEIFNSVSAIPSEYNSMKNNLIEGHSISVSLGGMREMLGDDYIVKRRRGIFKMAIETGTPIVPILSFGEDKLFRIVEIDPRIQKWLEKYDICICIPTLHSISKWFGMLHYPLKDPIISVAGKPIPVMKKDNPTEDDIAALRTTYIEALRELFTKENPNKSQTFSVI